MPQVEQKVVRVIQPNLEKGTDKRKKYSQKRVAAYCRVSTQQEEQINSYEVQTRYYTEKINAEPKWKLVQIFADRGISGTSTKHRGEFNKMIRMCKRGRIDMIITKSISRFARNTVDCLKYVSWHKNGVGKVFIKIRSHRTPSLRRMRNALSKVYMDISRKKTDSMEMYQPAGLWKEILSQLTDNR